MDCPCLKHYRAARFNLCVPTDLGDGSGIFAVHAEQLLWRDAAVSLARTTKTERKCKSLMTTVTQDMKYGQFLICCARKYA